jgi:O-antigen ligase
LNSQIVGIDQALKSNKTFIVLTSLIPFSLYLKAGFVSISVIWFFAICLYNYKPDLKHQFRTHYVLLFPIALFFLHTFWLFFSDNLIGMIDVMVRKIHFILIPLGFFIVNKKITHKYLQAVLVVFLTGCLLCTMICYAYAVYNVIVHNTWTVHVSGQDYPYFFSYLLTESVNISPVYLSMFCNFTFLIVLYTPLIKRTIYKAALLLYLAIFIFMVGVLTGILCMVVIMAIWLLAVSYKRIVIWPSMFAMLTLWVILNFSFLKENIISSFQFNYTDESGRLQPHTADKLVIWSSAIEAIKQKPILGYGTGDGQKALEEIYRKRGLEWEEKNSLNPHQEFLSTTLDFGIIGLVCLVAILIVPFVQAAKAKDVFAVCFLLVVTLFFLSESVLQRQKGIVFFSFFYSLLVVYSSIPKQVEQ